MIENKRFHVSWALFSLVATNLTLAVLACGVRMHFGSVRNAISYANGHRLLVDQSSKSLGTIEAGGSCSVQFKIKNASPNDINIIGAKTSCLCVATESLPLRLPPFSEREISVSVDLAGRTGDIHEIIFLFTDRSQDNPIKLAIHGPS